MSYDIIKDICQSDKKLMRFCCDVFMIHSENEMYSCCLGDYILTFDLDITKDMFQSSRNVELCCELFVLFMESNILFLSYI